MNVEKKIFGQTEAGQDVYLYSVSNSKGMRADIINFGAILVNLLVPDANGNLTDVVTGYDNLKDYIEINSFFGATVGPNANRIGGASFTLEGATYQLEVNDGDNNLHSHMELGYQKRVWGSQENDNGVTFTLEDEDGCMGFPGNKKIAVTYTVTEENELKIEYCGESDKNTIINLTNHTFFNLAGHENESIHDHILTLHASKYTPVVAGAIPTGELAPVAGTPMDFTSPKRVGDEIDSDFEQLQLVGGYDHNWVIDGADGTLKEIASVTDPVSGRTMITYTDLPGVQFYAGNFVDKHSGKEGVVYQKRCALCLETQYYPDTANKPEFPSAVFGPDRPYRSTTVYRFKQGQ